MLEVISRVEREGKMPRPQVAMPIYFLAQHQISPSNPTLAPIPTKQDWSWLRWVRGESRLRGVEAC